MKRSDRKFLRVRDKNPSFGKRVLLFCLIPALFAASPSGRSYNHVKVTSDTIVIEIDNVSLGDVLNNIQSKSGIGFDVPNAMRAQIIEAHVQAVDWKGALSLLLEEYSRIDVWEENQLKTVYLLKSNRFGDLFPSEIPASQNERGRRGFQPSSPVEDQILLTQDQARKVFSGGLRSPLSTDLLLDPELEDFLAEFGVENEEDLKDIKKAKRVRREARRQYRVLVRKARSQKN